MTEGTDMKILAVAAVTAGGKATAVQNSQECGIYLAVSMNFPFFPNGQCNARGNVL